MKVHSEVRKAIDSASTEIKASDGTVVGRKFNMMDAVLAVEQARERLREQNREEIDSLRPRMEELSREIHALKDQADRLAERSRKARSAVKQTWRDIARELELSRYLTANGQLSKANVAKLTNKDTEKIRAIVTRYNTQYVPRVNALARQAAEPYKPSDEDREFSERYNQRVTEHNRLVQRLRELSGE